MSAVGLNGVRVVGVRGPRSPTLAESDLKAFFLDYFEKAVPANCREPKQAQHALNQVPQVSPSCLWKTLANLPNELDEPRFPLRLALSTILTLVKRMPTKSVDAAQLF